MSGWSRGDRLALAGVLFAAVGAAAALVVVPEVRLAMGLPTPDLSRRQEPLAENTNTVNPVDEPPALTIDMIEGLYVRPGEFESAEIEIHRLPNGRVQVDGQAVWGKTREYGPNLGRLFFEASLNKGVIVRSDDEYRVELRFTGDGLLVDEEGYRARHGMGVTFKGTYIKMPPSASDTSTN
jgi:hypothetical protein